MRNTETYNTLQKPEILFPTEILRDHFLRCVRILSQFLDSPQIHDAITSSDNIPHR